MVQKFRLQYVPNFAIIISVGRSDMNVNQMNRMSREILTNPNFDFSSITWPDMVTMITFWWHRFARPAAACTAWVWLIYTKNVDMANRMARAVIFTPAALSDNKNVTEQDKSDLNDINYMWENNFYQNNFSKFGTIEDFNEKDAALQHNNWPKIALGILGKKEN